MTPRSLVANCNCPLLASMCLSSSAARLEASSGAAIFIEVRRVSSVLPGFLGDVMICKERGWVSAFQVRCRGCGEFLLLLLLRSHDEQLSLLTQQQPVAEYRVILGAVEALRHGVDEGLQRRVHGYIEQLAQRLRARMEMA